MDQEPRDLPDLALADAGDGPVGILASVGLGVVVARLLARQLGGEPGYAADVVGRIAGGDLTMGIQARSADSGSVLHSIKQMQDQLTRVVGKIKLSHRRDRDRLGPDRRGQPGPVLAHRGAGQLAGADRRVDGRADLAPSSRTPTTRARPTSWRSRPPKWRSRAATWSARWSTPWPRSMPRRRRSSTSSASSTASPSRPTSWRSTRRSKPRAPANRAAASRSWPPKCATSRSARPRRPRKSRA